jgi:hypothetical protein
MDYFEELRELEYFEEEMYIFKFILVKIYNQLNS